MCANGDGDGTGEGWATGEAAICLTGADRIETGAAPADFQAIDGGGMAGVDGDRVIGARAPRCAPSEASIDAGDVPALATMAAEAGRGCIGATASAAGGEIFATSGGAGLAEAMTACADTVVDLGGGSLAVATATGFGVVVEAGPAVGAREV